MIKKEEKSLETSHRHLTFVFFILRRWELIINNFINVALMKFSRDKLSSLLQSQTRSYRTSRRFFLRTRANFFRVWECQEAQTCIVSSWFMTAVCNTLALNCPPPSLSSDHHTSYSFKQALKKFNYLSFYLNQLPMCSQWASLSMHKVNIHSTADVVGNYWQKKNPRERGEILDWVPFYYFGAFPNVHWVEEVSDESVIKN